MNNKDKLMLMFSIVFLVFIILIFIQATRLEGEDQSSEESIQAINISPLERQTVSFILGEDKEEGNPFYANAESYFRYHPDAKTDEIISNCRSLACLNSQLYDLYQRNSRAFKTINIVVHSNPWSGISLPVTDGGMRITAEVLSEAFEENIISALPDEIVDNETEIVVYACGLGDNKALVSSLAKVIGGSDANKPKISTSKNYVNFTKSEDRVQKSEMEAYYAYYKTAYRPADLHLARQLQKRYPEVTIDWLSAIQKEEIDGGDEPFSYWYNVPVEWEIEYPEYDMPSLDTEMDKMEWLMNQDELLAIIEKTKIPIEYFRWKVSQGKKINEEDYIQTPFIMVKGKVTILCILKKTEVKEHFLNKA